MVIGSPQTLRSSYRDLRLLGDLENKDHFRKRIHLTIARHIVS
jgi:hypothetical protein